MKKSTRHLMFTACAALMLAGGTSEAARTNVALSGLKAQPTQEVFMNNLAAPFFSLSADQKSAHDNSAYLRAPMQPGAEQETLLEMNFDGFTEGSEEELGPHLTEAFITEGNPYIDPKYMNDQEGWWGVGVYSAGGACALARPNYGGAIATPMMNLYGNLHISCRVKVREGNTNGALLFFTIGSADIFYPQNPIEGENGIYINFKPEDAEKGWVDVSVDIECPYNGNDAFLQFNGVSYCKTGLLIDDIKITRDFNFVSRPTALHFGKFTNNSFTASWMPGAENKKYLVNLVEETVVTEEEVIYGETFENADKCEDWTKEGAVRVTEGGADNSAAIKFAGDASIQLPINYGAFKDLSLWASASSLGENSEAKLTIRVLEDDEWGVLGGIVIKNIPADGMEINIPELISDFSGHYTGIGFVTNGFAEGEYLIMDNLEWSTLGEYERRDVMSAQEVSENALTVTDIDYDKNYYMQVAGVNGELISAYTAINEVRGVAAPVMLTASDIDREGRAYTANWEEPKRATSYIVDSYAVRELEAGQNVEVFYDTFDNAHGDESGNLTYLEGYDFNGYANHEGWRIEESMYSVGYLDEGKIGGMVIYSPEMSLHNNNGEFTVRFTAYVPGNDNLVVQCDEDYQTVAVTAEFDPNTGSYDMGIKDVEMTFKNGSHHSSFILYTQAGIPFLISNFSVSQNINKGDVYFDKIASKTIEAGTSSLRIDNLPAASDKFAHHVYAVRQYDDGTMVTSQGVDNTVVDLSTTSVESVDADSAAVRVNNGTIEVILSQAAEITVCNASGVKVATMQGTNGINTIYGLDKGVYVVFAADKAEKIIL